MKKFLAERMREMLEDSNVRGQSFWIGKNLRFLRKPSDYEDPGTDS